MKIHISNKKKYQESEIIGVDLPDKRIEGSVFWGDVTIYFKGDFYVKFPGIHDTHKFLDRYGFIINNDF